MRSTRPKETSRLAAYRLPIALLFLAALGEFAWTAQTAPKVNVSQQGRMFQPGTVTVNQGDVVRIVNDDGDLLHHAYVESDNFNFDSGDQEPGSHTDITFSQPGTFTVLCGIHPKMKLIVDVKK